MQRGGNSVQREKGFSEGECHQRKSELLAQSERVVKCVSGEGVILGEGGPSSSKWVARRGGAISDARGGES